MASWPRRSKFSVFEDQKLQRLVSSMSIVNWAAIGNLMGNRTARQCRERYKNYLAPSVTTEPWTREEEDLLMRKHDEMGPHWAQMRQFFQNRTAVSLKNHYARIIQQSRRSSLDSSEPQRESPAEFEWAEIFPSEYVFGEPGADFRDDFVVEPPHKVYFAPNPANAIPRNTESMTDMWLKQSPNLAYTSVIQL
jgi:hypothetical protein